MGEGCFRAVQRGTRQQLPNSECHYWHLWAETESTLVPHTKCCLLISVLVGSLFIVENRRLQMIVTGHLHISFIAFCPSGCWWFCPVSVLLWHCAWKSAQIGSSCLWGENVHKTQKKKEEQQGKISKESCRSALAISSQLLEVPPLSRKRSNEYWKETCSQNFVTLSSLKALCVPISLLQISVSFFALSQMFCSHACGRSSENLVSK